MTRLEIAGRATALAALLVLGSGSGAQSTREGEGAPQPLRVRQDEGTGTIRVFRAEETEPILTQNAAPDFRPYLHPIASPDGRSVLTEFSPGHHKHQTGFYWGFTRVNGRDFFHHPEGDYWRRVSATVLEAQGSQVSWQTVYELLDEEGSTLLTETQTWSMRERAGQFLLDLDWTGEAQTDVTIGEYDYGGLFLRMPWREGMRGEVVNAARQRDQAAEGKRAMWLDVGIQLEGRDDLAHVAIFDHPDNGGFPQHWRVDGQQGVGPVRARAGDWTIPEGQTEVIRHRLVLHTGELDDVALNDAWIEFSGQGSRYADAPLWDIAQQEGREAEFLTPSRAAEMMTLRDGFEVHAWASEPMMTQPMAFAWDDRGRLWVAENRDFESRGDGFSNSGDSRILILEDTDRDGVADLRKVFLEGIPFPAAIAVGFDGLFLGAPPHLLFVPDRDGDDRADREDIEIRLTGWGIRDRHETINSLHWGPDGWLYGLEGFATPSRIRKPDAEDRLYRHKEPFPEDLLEREGVDINGGVWRYHPTKDRFEAVAHGFSNPWGIDYDAKGQLFISACVIPHLFHVIPGGIYQRQGGRHFNPYVYSDIGAIVDHRHRSAHGGARIYQSDAFPPEHQGRLFMANIHEHAVLSDVLEPQGSGFVASHGDDFLMANNAQWVGFSMEIGPEGALYVLDWHDADICGKDVLDKDTGRIFRIAPTHSLAEDWNGRYADLNLLSDEQLVELQLSRSDWHARRARVILQGRATKRPIERAAQEGLRTLFRFHPNPDSRLRAMWALHITGLLPGETLLEALEDEDEYVRAWAVQLLCEDRDPAAAAIARFATMAREDRSPVVRKYLAAALQRLDHQARWAIAEGLVDHGEDAEDHNIPKLIWFGLEPLVKEDPARALDLAGASQIPTVVVFTARRAVDADALEPLVARLETLPHARIHLLEGMRAGLEGRTDLEAPANWSEVYPQLRSDDAVAQRALEVAQLFGDADAAREMLASLTDQTTPLDQRRAALNGLAAQQRKELVAELPALLEEQDVRVEAIRAVAAFEERDLGRRLLTQYDGFSPAEKQEALRALASRPVYGRLLTEALRTEALPRQDVPAYLARQLRRVVGNGFVEVWGPIDELPGDKEARFARYRALLTNEALGAADASHGRLVFQQNCTACHTMYEEGGSVGPDLTGSNRTDLDYILSNMLSPSEIIQDDYKAVVVTTLDGRMHLGTVSAESERQVTLRVVGQDAVVINKSDIQSQDVTAVSMMPAGLLVWLPDADVLNLVAYLQTLKQVPLSAE